MASFFRVNVDTTAPAGLTLTLADGISTTTSLNISAKIEFTDNDVVAYKLYGDIVDNQGNVITEQNAVLQNLSATDKTNGYAETTVSLDDSTRGTKTVYCKVIDDVGNEGTTSDTITYALEIPVATITVESSKAKLSSVAPYNFLTFRFEANEDLKAYKVCTVSTTGALHSEATVIGTTGGSSNVQGTTLAKNTEVEVTIYTADLLTASPGDGEKIIKVFVQNVDDDWSV